MRGCVEKNQQLKLIAELWMKNYSRNYETY